MSLHELIKGGFLHDLHTSPGFLVPREVSTWCGVCTTWGRAQQTTLAAPNSASNRDNEQEKN